MRRAGRARRYPTSALALAAGLVAGSTGAAEGAPAGGDPSIVDRVVARFYAPEMGGPAQPHFIAERTLSFEARLSKMDESADGLGEGYDEGHVRQALDHHVAETMLAILAHKLVGGAAPGRRASDAEIARVESELSAAFVQRLGGRARVDAAAAAELLDGSEVDAIFRREALAAWYLDRTVAPLLDPTDEQLGEAFRTYAHPFRGRPFDRVRADFRRWLLVERSRSATSAFLEAARSRVVIVVTR